jgi:hypothetical protein
MVKTLVGNSDFWFLFLGPPSEAEFRSIFDSEDSGGIFFLNSAVKNWQIGIPILKFGIPKKD